MHLRITGGSYKGRRVRSARGSDLRPTTEKVRGAVFSMLGKKSVEGARVLDLFAGTGALGIEALSRGAAWVDLVEANVSRARQIRSTLHQLSLNERGRVYPKKTQNSLNTLPAMYDLVFADPPYDMMSIWDPLLSRLGEGDIVNESGHVVVEHRYGVSLQRYYGSLTNIIQKRYGDTGISIYIAGAVNG